MPRRICEALQAEGLGRAVLPCLERVVAVQKSAQAPTGGRPKPQQHRDSLRVVPTLDQPATIVLVDDVVTKGATFLAGAALLRAAFPQAQVSCFALFRTMGLVAEIEGIVAPVLGSIRADATGRVERDP